MLTKREKITKIYQFFWLFSQKNNQLIFRAA